jgi:hypothetical protein
MIAKKVERKSEILSSQLRALKVHRPFSPKSLVGYLPYYDRVSKPLMSSARALPFNLRTVFLILDRNIDLVPLLSHGWTYQALVSVCLEMKLNRVTVALPQKKA